MSSARESGSLVGELSRKMIQHDFKSPNWETSGFIWIMHLRYLESLHISKHLCSSHSVSCKYIMLAKKSMVIVANIEATHLISFFRDLSSFYQESNFIS